MLREQLAALREADFNLDVLGFDDQELARQLAEQERAAGFTDEDEVPDVPTAPVTRIGDLWLLGRREEQTLRNRPVGAHTRSASPCASCAQDRKETLQRAFRSYNPCPATGSVS